MNTKTLQTLEYDKIISMLTDQAAREFNSSKIKKYLSGRIGSGFFKSTNLSYYIVFYSIL